MTGEDPTGQGGVTDSETLAKIGQGEGINYFFEKPLKGPMMKRTMDRINEKKYYE